MRDRSKKTSAKKETRRLERKSERQATKAVLRGDHSSQPLSSNWGYKPEPVILSDDAKVVAPRGKSKGKRKICKRNKGGEHVPVFRNNSTTWWKNGYFCQKCDKHLWNHKLTNEERLANPTNEHWTTENIRRRLSGRDCICPLCLDRDYQEQSTSLDKTSDS